jgi:hypothetical protein
VLSARDADTPDPALATLVRLTKHESEGHNEKLVALIVADMQDPVTPILEAALVGEGLHDAGRMITRLSDIVNDGAAVIDEDLLRVGAVKIYLSHVKSPSNDAHQRGIVAPKLTGATAGM